MSIQYFILLFAVGTTLGEPLFRFQDGGKHLDTKSVHRQPRSKGNEGKQWLKAVEEMVKKIDHLSQQMNNLTIKMYHLQADVSNMDAKISKNSEKISRTNANITKLNTKISKTNANITSTLNKVLPSRFLRLNWAGDMDNNKGRVEVWHEGEWGTVCGDYLIDQYDNNTGQTNTIHPRGRTVANVVCKSLGKTKGEPIVTSQFKGERAAGAIWMDNVECKGHEKSLFECKFDWSYKNNDCWHYMDFSVTCS